MSDLKQIEWDLAGFCTVKALNPLALLSVNRVGFGRISTSNILSTPLDLLSVNRVGS
jgi:hypothetical protein